MPKEDPARGVNLIKTPLAEYTDEEDPQWKSIRFRAHDPDFSHILWPERFSKSRLMSIRQDYINLGFPDGYTQEYLNYPIDDTTAYFKKQDLLGMSEDDWAKSLEFYVGGDFAISTKSRADYTAFGVIGVDTEGTAYVMDIQRGRWDSYQIIETILAINKRYAPKMFYFEKGSIFSAIEPILLKETSAKGNFIPYDTVNPISDKVTRAQPFRFKTRAGTVKFDMDAPWYSDLETELVRFPKGSHDDQVDALATIFLKLAELEDAPSWREREEQSWNEEQAELEEFMETNHQSICGY